VQGPASETNDAIGNDFLPVTLCETNNALEAVSSCVFLLLIIDLVVSCLFASCLALFSIGREYSQKK
jgi:hypothetical protein